jgi:hypothetical protein
VDILPIQHLEENKEMSLFDLQTVGFLDLKNARSIADTHTPEPLLFIKSDYPNWGDKM